MLLSIEPLSIRSHATAALEPSGGYVGTVVPFFLSDVGFITAAADAPAHTAYEPRVQNPLSWETAIPITPVAGRRAAISYGETILNNGDGKFDDLVDRYSVDGRRIVIRSGRRGWPYADFETLFDGTADGWRAEDQAVRVRLRDNSYRLDVPLQENLYKGTGGLEGGDDLRGKPKPLAFGDLAGQNIPAILVDPNRLIYQVHDGQISELFRVYDKGAPLSNEGEVGDIITAQPSAGAFVSERGRGLFRLGSTPAGLVTCDLHGDSTGSFAVNASDIALRILLTRSSLGAADIDGMSFAALRTLQPASVGYWFGTEPLTVAGALDSIMGGIFAWWGAGRQGGITCGRLDAPSINSVATFSDVEILDIARLELPEELNPLVWRMRIGFAPNYAVQTTDLAGVVTAERRQFLSQEYRITTASREQNKFDYLQARDPDPLISAISNQADAEMEVTRQLGLFGVRRQLYQFTTKLKAYRRQLGETITLQHSRYGLAAGRAAVIVGLGLDTGINQSTVTCMV